MKVHVVNKRTFDQLMVMNNITDENVEKRDNMFLISIIGTDTDNPYADNPDFAEQWAQQMGHYFKEDHDNVMNLQFDDVEHDGGIDPMGIVHRTKAFSEKQAERLFKFIEKNRDKEQCIVHCMAGVSRSGAVGEFINGYAQGDWATFKRMNPQILPNGRVLRMLNAAKYNNY